MRVSSVASLVTIVMVRLFDIFNISLLTDTDTPSSISLPKSWRRGQAGGSIWLKRRQTRQRSGSGPDEWIEVKGKVLKFGRLDVWRC